MTTPLRALLAAVTGAGMLTSVACGDGGRGAAGRDGPDTGLAGTVTVFAAASLTDVLTEAADAFEAQHPDVTVEVSFAGSPSLREQILAGAPADVYASADGTDMDELAAAGELAGDPRVFARNSLQIVVPAGNPGAVDGLSDLGDPGLLVGLCAAEVPCGRLGLRALAEGGVTPEPDTEEPDVRSLLTKVAAGELDAGLVYRTDVIAGGDDVEGVALDPAVAAEIGYPVATLARSDVPDIASAFVDALVSDTGRSIVESHGFAAP